ncbi:MAG: nucleoside recognition protein [Odoribacter sp.]
MLKERVVGCIQKVLPVAFKTSLWFLKIMLPVSFCVMLLSYFNILPYLSSLAAPLFTLLGLPGDAALVFVTSIFTNIYTVIALMSNLDFSIREGIILATMCLISHNYLVETLVQKKTGSSAIGMVLLRFSCSFVAAIVLNFVLPEMSSGMIYQPAVVLGLSDTLLNWLQNSLILSLKIICIISLLMIVQRLLEEFGILKWLSTILGPLVETFGLPKQVAFLWLVGNTLGLAYGSAVLMDYARQGKLTRRESDLLNYHLAISHSQLEDPLLFAVLGLPMLWLIIPRLILAIVVVWLKRFGEIVYRNMNQYMERRTLESKY